MAAWPTGCRPMRCRLHDLHHGQRSACPARRASSASSWCIVGALQGELLAGAAGRTGMILGAGLHALPLSPGDLRRDHQATTCARILDLVPREIGGVRAADRCSPCGWASIRPASPASAMPRVAAMVRARHQAALAAATRLAGDAALMNWTIALPEIVLSFCGMAHPDLRRARAKRDTFLPPA